MARPRVPPTTPLPPRLLAWSAAFEAWVAEHEPIRAPKTISKWKRAWQLGE